MEILGTSPEATVKTNHVTNRLMFEAEYYVAVQYDDDDDNGNDDNDDVSVLTMGSKEEEHSNDDDDDDDNCTLGGHLTSSSHHACHHYHHHHGTNISLHEIRKYDNVDCHHRLSSSYDENRLHDSKNTLSTLCSSHATASNKSMSAPIQPQRTRSPSPSMRQRHSVRGYELSDSLSKPASKHSSSPWGTCSEHPMSQPKSTSLQTRSSHLPPNKPLRYQSRIYENHYESDDDDDDDESGTSFHDDYIDPFLKTISKEPETLNKDVRNQSPRATECPK